MRLKRTGFVNLTTLGLTVSLGMLTGCPAEPDPPVSPDNPDTPQRMLIEEGAVLTPGGKVPGRRYWVWDPAEKRWSEETYTVGPLTLRDDGLAGGARAATTSTTLSAGGAQTISKFNAALFAGGIGVRPDFIFATPQAYLFEIETGEWTGVEMTTPRTNHTLTTLLDGRVLVVGGWDGKPPQSSLASAEVFDPDTLSFAATGSMSVGRLSHAAARLTDGRVLVAGGVDSAFATLNSAEIYDPATGTFTATGSMAQPRSAHFAVTLDDGRVLVAGSNGLRAAEVFDPATGAFSAVGDMVSFHGFGASATKLRDGRVLVLGGRGDDRGVEPTDAAELFDPVANAFTAVAPMSRPRDGHMAVLLGEGVVLIAGGNSIERDGPNIAFTILATSEQFDPATNTFAPLPDAPGGGGSDGVAVFLQR